MSEVVLPNYMWEARDNYNRGRDAALSSVKPLLDAADRLSAAVTNYLAQTEDDNEGLIALANADREYSIVRGNEVKP